MPIPPCRFRPGDSTMVDLLVLLTQQSTVVRMTRRLVAPGVKRPLPLHRKRFHHIIRSFGWILLFSYEPPSLLLPFDAIQRRPSNDRARGAMPPSWLPTVVPAPQGQAFVG